MFLNELTSGCRHFLQSWLGGFKEEGICHHFLTPAGSQNDQLQKSSSTDWQIHTLWLRRTLLQQYMKGVEDILMQVGKAISNMVSLQEAFACSNILVSLTCSAVNSLERVSTYVLQNKCLWWCGLGEGSQQYPHWLCNEFCYSLHGSKLTPLLASCSIRARAWRTRICFPLLCNECKKF